MNRFAVSTLALFLAGCIGGSDNTATAVPLGSGDTPAPDAGGEEGPQESDVPPGGATASCEGGDGRAGGRHYRVELPSRVDAEPVVFEVFEPAYVDCRQKHPLILEGHGFQGSRQTSYVDSFMAPIATLTDAGYAVISVDQRGHGESGGSFRLMDPDHDGRDLVQIVDWAEENLDYLAYRDDNLLLGSVGGSYGGGFQYLLYAVDPGRRLDAMVPQITWHDLDYSLNPGGVPKSRWGFVFSAMGEANAGVSMDPLLRATLLEAGVTHHMPEVARDFFSYHSMAYHCGDRRDLELAGARDDAFDPATQLLPATADGQSLVRQPPTAPYPVDVLMFQGVGDTLFNLNEAWRNYQCLKAAGGDVRLLSYGLGHHSLQSSIGLVQYGADDSETWVGSLDAVARGQVGASAGCGGVDVIAATLAWFDEKLRGRGKADDVIAFGKSICLYLGEGDELLLDSLPTGGIERQVLDWRGEPVRARTGLAGALPTPVPLGTLAEDAVIAGIPRLEVTVAAPGGRVHHCPEEDDPGSGGECDAILFVGVGVLRHGLEPELVNGQVMPVRGLGRHQLELVALTERLHAGDRLFLMLYGAHPTFVTGMSRHPAVLRVEVSGSVRLPLLTADGKSLADQKLVDETRLDRRRHSLDGRIPVSLPAAPGGRLDRRPSFTF